MALRAGGARQLRIHDWVRQQTDSFDARDERDRASRWRRLARRNASPSASDLSPQLVGNPGIRSVKFTDLNSWQCGLHSARISLSGENIPQAHNK